MWNVWVWVGMLQSHCDYHIPFNKMTRWAPWRLNINMKLLLWLSSIPHTQISTLWSKRVLSITRQEQEADLSEIPSQVCQSPFVKLWTLKKVKDYYRCAQLILQPRLDKLYQCWIYFCKVKPGKQSWSLMSRHLCGIKYPILSYPSWLQDLNCSAVSTDT